MNKNIQTKTIKPIKKMQNPFMKYKDMEVTRTDSSVDFNFSVFKENSKKEYTAEKLKLFGLAASGVCAPLIATSYLTNHPSVIPIAIASLTFSAIGGYNTLSQKKEAKKVEGDILNMVEYSQEQKTYLFKKMYTEFEKHLENGKKLVDNLVRAGVIAAGSIGIAVFTQMDSLRTFTTGLAIGCGIYAAKKVLEHLGEKRAIEIVQSKMEYDEDIME
jgi:hypothetical protein